ncbi:MAG: hypothetical protein JNJ54_34860 [Myxococcaceae bacterium]|nr:hypothetical protein [Myxococcaceae bacterium]
MALTVRIASPCSEPWESMTGDERTRFCAKCQLSVHNVKELTEAETLALLQRATGRVCGRIFQRADGTVLTKDCPVGVATVRRRFALSLVAVAAFVVALVGVVAGAARQRSDGTMTFREGLRTRFTDVKERLRDSVVFGPIIERLDPQPHVLAGEMVAVPPSTTGAP